MHKITHNSMNKLSRGPPKEHLHQIWGRSVQRFERRSRKTKKKVHGNYNNDDDDRHIVIGRVTLTHWVWLKWSIYIKNPQIRRASPWIYLIKEWLEKTYALCTYKEDRPMLQNLYEQEGDTFANHVNTHEIFMNGLSSMQKANKWRINYGVSDAITNIYLSKFCGWNLLKWKSAIAISVAHGLEISKNNLINY